MAAAGIIVRTMGGIIDTRGDTSVLTARGTTVGTN